MKRLLEIACFNVASALAAEKAGADRIEFCLDYSSGGITPHESDILYLKSQLKIPLYVLIRCRSGNFFYSTSEINTMTRSIEFCRDAGVNGVVFGALNLSLQPDINKCEKLAAAAGGLDLTFHRAFDACKDFNLATESLISLGFSRILTSGGASNVLEGLPVLSELQRNFGNKIVVMPGGGLRSEILQQLLSLGFVEFHSSALTKNLLAPDENEIVNMKKLLSL